MSMRPSGDDDDTSVPAPTRQNENIKTSSFDWSGKDWVSLQEDLFLVREVYGGWKEVGKHTGPDGEKRKAEEEIRACRKRIREIEEGLSAQTDEPKGLWE